MTNPPSTAPDGATADSGVKVEAFTPGPWTAHQGWADGFIGELEQHPDWCEITSEYDANYRRLSVTGHCGIANARLIAGAPDLLEAARLGASGVEFFLRMLEDERPEFDQTANRKSLATIYAAIAKATGQ